MRLRIKAVRQWRYNPKVVDGRPVKKPGYESLFHSNRRLMTATSCVRMEG